MIHGMMKHRCLWIHYLVLLKEKNQSSQVEETAEEPEEVNAVAV